MERMLMKDGTVKWLCAGCASYACCKGWVVGVDKDEAARRREDVAKGRRRAMEGDAKGK